MNHTFPELFKQLGLPDDHQSIASFLSVHRPLDGATALEDAAFWSPSQRNFIKEQLANDADWVGVLDQMSVALR